MFEEFLAGLSADRREAFAAVIVTARKAEIDR